MHLKTAPGAAMAWFCKFFAPFFLGEEAPVVRYFLGILRRCGIVRSLISIICVPIYSLFLLSLNSKRVFCSRTRDSVMSCWRNFRSCFTLRTLQHLIAASRPCTPCKSLNYSEHFGTTHETLWHKLLTWNVMQLTKIFLHAWRLNSVIPASIWSSFQCSNTFRIQRKQK